MGGGGDARILTAADFSDSLNATTITMSGQAVIRCNALASVRLAIGAGCWRVNGILFCNDYGTVETSFPIYLDGTYWTSWTPAGNYPKPFTLAMDRAAHTLEIVSSWQQYGIQGAFLYALSSVGGSMTVLPNPTVSRRLAVYGDSIANGALADLTARHGWIGLLRAGLYSGRVSAEVWGGRTLNENGSPYTTLAARLVGLTFGAARREIWDAMGYNDFYSAPWNATDFGAGCGALYDAIHALDPAVKIFAQTPIITGNEAATNAFGNTIVDYRAAKASAAASRSSFVTVVDGTTLLSAGQLSGGVHPATAGHASYASAVAAILG